MKVYKNLDFKLDNTAVSLGKFDGIHAGHRLLLNNIMNQKGLSPSVFTFDAPSSDEIPDSGEINTSNLNILNVNITNGENSIQTGCATENDVQRRYIYTEKEKEYLLETAGIENMVSFGFNEALKNMDAEIFIKEILIKRMNTRYICVGEDFRFGKGRSGSVHTLKRLAAQYNYDIDICQKLRYESKEYQRTRTISSTLIRSLIKKGCIDEANILLTKPYMYKGKVLRGKQIGRTISFPTVNMAVAPGRVVPPSGVYATHTVINGITYQSVSNLGTKPTIGNNEINIETHIIDFNQQVYGEEIEVYIDGFIRKEMKFENVEKLKSQIQRDVQAVKQTPKSS